MQSLKDTLRQYKQRLSDAVPPRHGSNLDFETAERQWQETCTHDSVLDDFTTFLLEGFPMEDKSTFTEKEARNLQKIFAAHANLENCWNQKSLESYLLTQIPQDGNFKILLAESMPSLWTLITSFAQWPFNTTTSTPITSLKFHALVRATAFLCGRHSYMFRPWYSVNNGGFNRKTDQLVLEYIFRALATSHKKEQGPLSSSTSAKLSLQRDILDLLTVAQPLSNYPTGTLSRSELTPTANSLSPPTPPETSDLSLPTTVLIPLLELSISLLQHITEFDKSDCPISLKENLEAALTELQQTAEVSFDMFWKCLDSDRWVKMGNMVYTLYDSLALLFNTFPNPESLRTGKQVNWLFGHEETLYLAALRNLGITLDWGGGLGVANLLKSPCLNSEMKNGNI